MRVLVVGGGARGHALVWRISSSPLLERNGLFVAPRNAGTLQIATNLPVRADDVEGLVCAAKTHSIDLVVVGPELPLSLGLTDRLQAEGIMAFGPSRKAAVLETSKSTAIEIGRVAIGKMYFPESWFFDNQQEAEDFVRSYDVIGRGRIVVKADGLAGGKGVRVCDTLEQALEFIFLCMGQRVFGAAGDRIVIQQRVEGCELSVFAFCDGQQCYAPVIAYDYKRLLAGDRGPITGGMGSWCFPTYTDTALAEKICDDIMTPIVREMGDRGTPYRGVLYAGIMLTPQGPVVLEFNCRFGDPEAQVILPLLGKDLLEIAWECASGDVSILARYSNLWGLQACVGIVLASAGYPDDPKVGRPISGLNTIPDDILVFHGGTKVTPEGQILTDGGRVFTVDGKGNNLEEAQVNAARAASMIGFEGVQWRRDIGFRARRRI